jgi:hypothetical protein
MLLSVYDLEEEGQVTGGELGRYEILLVIYYIVTACLYVATLLAVCPTFSGGNVQKSESI